MHIHISQSSFFNCEPTVLSHWFYLKSKHTQKSLFPRSFQSRWENSSVLVTVLTQSCPTLCDPLDWSPPGSSVRRIFQARILEWVAIPYSRGSCPPRDWAHISWVSCIGITTSATPWCLQTNQQCQLTDRWPGFSSGEGRKDHFGCMLRPDFRKEGGGGPNGMIIMTKAIITICVQYLLFPR